MSGFDFLECDTCRLVFAPAVEAPKMTSMYEKGYHGPQDGAPHDGWANLLFLEPAFSRLPRGPLAILDFGCGESRVPALLRAHGHRVVAVDVAPPRHSHPDRLTGSLLDLALPAAQFDLAFAFQVFEHLPEPRPYLEELLRVTRPGGLVLIHTDMHTPERQSGFSGWWYVTPPDHCTFYSHHTFEAVVHPPHAVIWRDEKSVMIAVDRDTTT